MLKSTRLTSLRLLFFVGFLFCSASAVQADVVYDNGAGSAGGVNGAVNSDDRSSFYIADDVTLGETTFITGVEWTGQYKFGDGVPQAVDQFSIAIYGDAGGEPTVGVPLELFDVGNNVNRTDSGFVLSGQPVYSYDAEISFPMQAGETYWVSIYNNSELDDDRYYWNMLFDAGNSFASGDGGASWSSFSDRHDFRLTSVPEPASAVLVVLGIAVCGMRRKR